ncbi:MAG: COG1361 S-layer family protein [Lachnospiraceae bacterium]
MKKFNAVIAVCMSFMVMFLAVMAMVAPRNVFAEGTDPVGETSTENQTTTAAPTDYVVGDTNDVKIEGVITESAGAGGVAGIGFKVKLDDNYVPAGTQIKSVRPKADGSSPFVSNSCMFQIAEPDLNDTKKNELWCGFVFDVKGNITTNYYSIPFEVEYVKPDGLTYRITKSIDVCLFGKEEETTTSDVATSVPRIIVTGYETNPSKVMAGQEFELTVHLQNTSNRTAVSNVKVTLSSADNVFLPSSGSSTEFIRTINRGATKDIVIKMKAQASLEQKPYVLTVACEYEGEKNAAYTASESISIPVYQEAKLKVTDVEIMPESMEVYGQANVMFSINNTGKSTLYNVQVSVDPSCTSVQSDDAFIGNINSGSTGYADFMVTGIAPTTDDGKVKLIISYEDAAGEVGTFETEVNLFVYEPVYNDMPTGDEIFEDPGMMEEPSSSSSWIWILIGVAVVIVVIIVTVVLIKKAKKKALEKELNDEIS